MILAAVLALSGVATWYDAPSKTDAAAGPELRRMLGSDWRGSEVIVCADDCITVTLTDWCACGDRNGRPTLIDLDDQAFAELAPLGTGVLRVTVRESIPLPPTDALPEYEWRTHR